MVHFAGIIWCVKGPLGCGWVSRFLPPLIRNLESQAWGVYNPQWLVNAPQAQLPSLLAAHVAKLVPHFVSGTSYAAYCWDVVNEAIADGNDPSAIFKPATPWYPAGATKLTRWHWRACVVCEQV